MATGVYQQGDSWLHRADPPAKIVSLLAWFVIASLLSRPATLAALAATIVLMAASAGLLPTLGRFARFMATLFVMCVLLWTIFSSEPGGLQKGIWMGLRLVSMLSMGLLFLASTRVEDAASGLRRLGLPFMAAFSLTLAFRLLPLFATTASTIVSAQACRGLDIRQGGILRRIGRYLPLLVPLVLSSLRSADALSAALESRGLGMGPTRTFVAPGAFRSPDALQVAVSAGLAATVIALKATGSVV